MWGENKVFEWRGVVKQVQKHFLPKQNKSRFLTSQWTVKLVKHIWIPYDENSKEKMTSVLVRYYFKNNKVGIKQKI